MAETMGSLVDKLCTVGMKLWAIQDKVHWAADHAGGLDPDTTKKLKDLNHQRNRLMTEIDELLDRSIKAGGAEVDARPKF